MLDSLLDLPDPGSIGGVLCSSISRLVNFGLAIEPCGFDGFLVRLPFRTMRDA